MPIRQASAPFPVFFTDHRVEDGAVLLSIKRLPRDAWVIFRHYATATGQRAAFYAKVRRAARRRGVRIIFAGAEPLRFADSDGWHASGWRGLTPRRAPPISASAHHMIDLTTAKLRGARAVFISPIFATRSHQGARPMGPFMYQRIARRAESLGIIPLPLGGMTKERARMLKAKGFGAIDALIR